MKSDFIVEKVEMITPSTVLVTLNQQPGERLFTFQPGQYAAISFKHKVRPSPVRCFSIVNSPTEQGILQFGMRVGGRFTKKTTQLVKGDSMSVRGPFGGFVFDIQHDNDAVFLAGGIGITPFMSMMRFVATTQTNKKITLLYSCRNQDEVAFGSEIRELAHRNHAINPFFVIGEGSTDKFDKAHALTGRITPEMLDQVVPNLQDKKFFICGPPPFMKALVKTLKSKGVPKRNIMTEAFSQDKNRQTGKIRSWPFNMYALSAVGLMVASGTVMITDLLRTLPFTTILDPNSTVRQNKLTSSRQADLNALVNNLPNLKNDGPPTNAVSKALKDAEPKTPKNSTSSSNQTQTASPNSPSPSTPKNSSQSTSNATSPSPAPAPKCTTTQSGVTTCI